MNFWTTLFGRNRGSHKETVPDVLRRHMDSSDVVRVSCIDVARTIRERVAEFVRSRGMVVVVAEGSRIEIYYFDGTAKVSWGYNNHQFSTDPVGQTFLVGQPTVFALTPGEEPELSGTLQREFAHCEMTVGKLWTLDPTAWDYEAMEILHRDDVGIRISFNRLPDVK